MPNTEKATLINADNTPVNSTNPLPVSISGSGGGDVEVVGNVAAASADSGNPVKIGGVFNTTKPTYTNGQRGDIQQDARGNINVSIFGSGASSGASGVSVFTANADNIGADTTLFSVAAFPYAFDGTNWDRLRTPASAVGSLLVEQGPYLLGRATADAQIKGAAGFIHTVSIAPLTATPTAGLLTIYNSTAESGTVVYAEWIFATTPGHTVTLDIPCGTGIYVGFDGTLANVQVTVSYR